MVPLVEPFSLFWAGKIVEPFWFHILVILRCIVKMWNHIGSTIFPAQKVILHYREWLYSVVSLSGLGKLWKHFGSTFW